MAREEWPKIKADIDSGHLSALGLIQIKSLLPTDIGQNHQVMVYGYELSGSTVTLHIYDPNELGLVGDGVTLTLNIGFTDRVIAVFRAPNNEPINCFFRTSYSFVSPPLGTPSLRLFLIRKGADPAGGVRTFILNTPSISVRTLLAT